MTATLQPSAGAAHAAHPRASAPTGPSRVVPNAELVEAIDSSDEWIQQRSGIKERRFAGRRRDRADDVGRRVPQGPRARRHRRRADRLRRRRDRLAHAADPGHRHRDRPRARHRQGGRRSTSPPPAPASATASRSASDMVRAGSAKHVLVIGVERLSDITDLNDRGTAFIFADGAGAAVIGPSDEAGIGPVVWGSDGEQYDLIRQNEDWRDVLVQDTPTMPHLTMQGNPVFRWASFEMAKVAQRGPRPGRHHRRRPRRVRAPPGQHADHRRDGPLPEAARRTSTIARDIADQGNTSAASIPLALGRMIDERRGQERRHRAADRLRRRPGVRRPGRPRPLAPRVPGATRPEHEHRTTTPPQHEGVPRMATTEEIRADLADIVNEVAGIPADDVQLDKSFVDDLDVDSLSMVEVVVAAEEKFDVKIPDDEVKNLKTVGDAVAFIERAQNG